ncbi:MAG: hypothetical protein HQK49_21595 [Oligoflexia bacterium]|nr:hypothetical protein [Oligoflexia bacterium]
MKVIYRNISMDLSNNGTTLAAWSNTLDSTYYVLIDSYYQNNWYYSTIENAENPAVAVNRTSGNGVISYTDKTSNKIKVVFVQNGALMLSEAVAVSEVFSDYSSVAMNNNGDVVVVWGRETTDDTYFLEGKIYSHGSWSETITLSFSTSYSAVNFDPEVKIDDNGNILVIWEAMKSGTDIWHIYKSEFRNSTWSIPTINDNISPDGGGDVYHKKMVRNKHGTTYIVWSQEYENDRSRHIYISSYVNGVWKKPLNNDDHISTSLKGEEPSVTINDNNDAIVIWYQYILGKGYEIYEMKIKNSVISPPTGMGIITRHLGWDVPNIEMNNNGNAIMVWYGVYSNDSTVDLETTQLYKSEYFHGKWYHPTNRLTENISFVASWDPFPPSVGIDDNDNARIYWSQQNSNSLHKVYRCTLE